jgi:CDP-diglyceride synthetase
MIIVVGLAAALNVMTKIPFVMMLIVVVFMLCMVELGSFKPKKDKAKDAVTNQVGIVMLGTFVVIAGLVLLKGDTIISIPLLGQQLSLPNNLIVVILIMFSTIIFENTLALAAGKAWRWLSQLWRLKPPRPVYPRYSPEKTVVGSVVGVVGGIVLGLLVVWLLKTFSDMGYKFYVLLIVLAIITPPLAEFGDWIGSRMKRLLEVESSSQAILEGGESRLLCWIEKGMGDHGGFVDRTDSMFFCLIWSLLPTLAYIVWAF